MIEIIKPGLYTTIQDLGRERCTHYGVPTSGAMDACCAKDANRLLGNDLGNSVLECTLIGPEILFHKETVIIITGAVIQPFINGKPSYINRVIKLFSGDMLTFGKIVQGARFYIGVRGGFQGQRVLGSQSACITSSILSIIKKGDSISFANYDGYYEQPTLFIRKIGNKKIKVQKGPEYEQLSKLNHGLDQVFKASFTVSQESNRMAYRVNHEFDFSHMTSILSSGTLPGTVQLTPNGDLIFLMRDAQTTGGYPRILQLSEEGICDLAQLKTGDKFELELI